MSLTMMLIHAATVRRFAVTGQDDLGHDVTASSDLATDVPCRLIGKTAKEIRDGVEVTVAGSKVLMIVRDVVEDDELVIDGRTFEILGITSRNDGSGPHHLSIDVREIRA